MATIVVTPNTTPVMTAAQAAVALRIDDEAEYPYLDSVLIPAVSALFEDYTRCKLLNTTLLDLQPCWPASRLIGLAWGPQAAVESVQYLDQAGVVQQLPAQAWSATSDGGVWLAPNYVLPQTARHPQAVRVRYTAGFGNQAADVPAKVLLWLQAHLIDFSNRAGAHTEAKVVRLPYIDHLIADYCRPTI